MKEEGDMNIIYTIGHSTRTIEEFIGILQSYAIETVADVRTIAGSRRNPQYNQDELSRSLSRKNIGYIHCQGLGGLRHSTKDSINTAWRNTSFRGYADYMQTEEFKENIVRLIALAEKNLTALMCAEAVPWRCHRSLIGDALLMRNISVVDIMNEKSSKPHVLTPFARIDADVITYPAEKSLLPGN
jgi:uncharacterized protein (DUF488 family)